MTPETENHIKEILSYYKSQPAEQDVYLEMLREILEITGRLSENLLDWIAKEMEVKPSFLSCLVKFSPELRRYAYEHEIVVCTGARCGKKDSLKLLRMLKKELEPDKNGISKDKKIHLSTRNCLKHCKTAPNILVDGELISSVTSEQLPDLLRKLRC
ncbi:MAG: NAD(P)H-dependent oxidoreductase subunit E [Eubacteriales bacterium]|nr:NAD(P)H-dependent oxidoreductase subunit E [Eubacteriales bacterium]